MKLRGLAFALLLVCGCEGNINDDDFPLAFTGRASLSSTGVQGNLASDQASVSRDSRWVVFRSSATNLHVGDTNGLQDVFLRDLVDGETFVVSMAGDVAIFPIESMGFTPGGGNGGDVHDPGGGAAPSNGASSEPVVADGASKIYFASFANNLDPDGARNPTGTSVKNVYQWDQATRLIKRVSMPTSGKDTNGESGAPSCSTSGKEVVYQSLASNLIPVDANGWDLFLYDDSGATRLVSTNGADVQANGDCTAPQLSADGRVLVFTSIATNLDGDPDPIPDVFWKDLATGEVRLVSTPAGGPKGTGASTSPSVSADGRYVVFASDAPNLVPSDTNVATDIFLKDMVTGDLTRLSLGPSGIQSDGASRRPSISADASTVVFESAATNLIILDTNVHDDVFVVDTAGGAPRRVSVRTFGVEALGGDTGAARISGDGSLVAMESNSANLVDGDTNSSRDVFYRAPLK